MGRGESAQPAHLNSLPALRGGKGGDDRWPLSFYSAVLRALGLPTLALPIEWGGEKMPTLPIVGTPGSSRYPPRFAGREKLPAWPSLDFRLELHASHHAIGSGLDRDLHVRRKLLEALQHPAPGLLVGQDRRATLPAFRLHQEIDRVELDL